LQLVNAAWYCSSFANADAILSSEAGRRIEKISGASGISATASASSSSARRLFEN